MYYISHNKLLFLQITGPDKDFFLQGIITQDIHKLAVNNIIYTVMLQFNGRFSYEFFLLKPDKERIILVAPQKSVETIKHKLDLFTINNDVSIVDISATTHFITLHGDKIDCLLVEEENKNIFLNWDPRSNVLGKICIMINNSQCPFIKDLAPTDSSQYTLLKIKNCIPSFNSELIPGKTIPLEANLEELNAISFNKGCYLGQELTARTKQQGLVRKKLYTVLLKNDIEINQTIFYNEQKSGVLLSKQFPYGIAKLRIEHVKLINSSIPKIQTIAEQVVLTDL